MAKFVDNDKNSESSRGIVSGCEEIDLSTCVLGARKTPAGDATFVLGNARFQVTLSTYQNYLSNLEVLEGGSQLFWVSPWKLESIERSELLGAITDAIRANTLDPLNEFFLKNTDSGLVELTAQPLVQEVRERQARLIQSAQYRDVEIGAPNEFRARLAELPFHDINSAIPDFVRLPQSRRGRQAVPVSNIIGTSNPDDSWLLNNGRGRPYIFDMAHALKSGALVADSRFEPISLFDHHGQYWVAHNGRHRVAAIKGMVSERELTVMAEVIALG